jgi:hypothetical protein
MADRKGPPRGSSEYYRSRAALHSQAGAAARSGTADGVKKSIALTRRADKLDVKASRSPKAAEMLGVLDRLTDESERYDKITETTTSYPDAYLCFVFPHKTATDEAMAAAGLDASTWLHSGDIFNELVGRLAQYRAKFGPLD